MHYSGDINMYVFFKDDKSIFFQRLITLNFNLRLQGYYPKFRLMTIIHICNAFLSLGLIQCGGVEHDISEKTPKAIPLSEAIPDSNPSSDLIISTRTVHGYPPKQVHEVTIKFQEAVLVIGRPKIPLSNKAYLVYLSGSGTDSLLFEYIQSVGKELNDGSPQIIRDGAIQSLATKADMTPAFISIFFKWKWLK